MTADNTMEQQYKHTFSILADIFDITRRSQYNQKLQPWFDNLMIQWMLQ